jgi:acyl phosphate:glycerol-3-phosphate acyltransferase
MASFFPLLAYFFGSIPSGILVARAMGLEDPRRFGSGNIGASNLTRLGGRKVGGATFVLDFLKGLVPVLAARFYSPGDPSLAYLAALLAVAGHCYSVFLRFQGGKGVATTVGAFCILAPLPMAAALAAWGLVFYATRTTSLAALVAVPILLCVHVAAGSDHLLIFAAFISALLVVRRHKSNLLDLISGHERSF